MSEADKTPEVVGPEEVARKLRTDYAHGQLDPTMKSLEAVSSLCWDLERSDVRIMDFLANVADLISRHFGIAGVTIAVRDPDRHYRYKVMSGLERDAVLQLKSLSYTKAQVLDGSVYPGHVISSHTKLYLAEDHPFTAEEEASYKYPGLIGMKRRSLTESLEADYLDFFFYDQDNEILGWIETSGTRLRKLPDAVTVRWIELIAVIVGHAVQMKR